jgi:hypothetical protein
LPLTFFSLSASQKTSSFAKPVVGGKIFVVSLPPATSQELSPLSESSSLPPVPFERVAANSSGITGAGGNAGTTNQTTNASNSN